jgi:hypothetical protein
MRKVMLVIDEIQQLVGLESFLRRFGFDVLSLSKDSQVADAQLGFMPDIVIASHQGRNVDGLKLSRQLKRTMRPPPRIAICYSSAPPSLTKDDERSIDALLEIPAVGESAIRLLAQLAGVKTEPLLEKYRRFANARFTSDEQVVIVQGVSPTASAGASEGASTGASSTSILPSMSGPWDPMKTPGTSASSRSERSNRYDTFLENHAKDLANGAAEKVLPRERAAQLMKKLKDDSAGEKDALDEIQAQKIKFAEALFEEGAENGAENTDKKNK